MSTYTMKLYFLAPIPVGHRIQLDFYSCDRGVFGEKFQLDRARPVLTDLETSICWGHEDCLDRVAAFGEHRNRRFEKSYYGRVLECTVASCGGDTAGLETWLVIDPMEPPGAHGPYRSSDR